MSTDVWLEKFGIVHMGDKETPPMSDAKGHTMLFPKEVYELAEILKWIEDEQMPNMMFWQWQHNKREGEDGPYNYWRLCPCITFFDEDDAVRFKLTHGIGIVRKRNL